MRKPTIAELEKLLDAPAGDYEIKILPNGEIRSSLIVKSSVIDLLRSYAADPDACLKGTQMVPISQVTIGEIIELFDRNASEHGAAITATSRVINDLYRDRTELWALLKFVRYHFGGSLSDNPKLIARIDAALPYAAGD